VTGRIFFEEVIRENLDIGRPSQVSLIFDRRINRQQPLVGPDRPGGHRQDHGASATARTKDNRRLRRSASRTDGKGTRSARPADPAG
jgi:hypothetical protein